MTRELFRMHGGNQKRIPTIQGCTLSETRIGMRDLIGNTQRFLEPRHGSNIRIKHHGPHAPHRNNNLKKQVEGNQENTNVVT